MKFFDKPLLKPIGTWLLVAFFLNLGWEVVQLPLYVFPAEVGPLRIAYYVLHCTVGDLMISGACFLGVGLLVRDTDWVTSQPWRGCALAILLGVSYTSYSEWVNVYQQGSWAYSSQMPLLFGIGLSPLLQWLSLPFIGTLILRRFRKKTTL